MVRPRGTDSANQQVQSVLKKRGINMNDVLSAAQAARVIGCASKKVSERLKRKIWTFGEAIPPKQKGETQYSYEVNKQALADWLKIPVEEVDRRLNG